jgi:hypothetical protein
MSIVMHCFYRHINMQPPLSEANRRKERMRHWRSGFMRLKPGLKRRSKGLLSRGASDDEGSLAEASEGRVGGSGLASERSEREKRPSASGGGGSGGGLGSRAQKVLGKIVGLWQAKPAANTLLKRSLLKPRDDGGGAYQQMKDTAEGGGASKEPSSATLDEVPTVRSRAPSLRRLSSNMSNGGGEEDADVEESERARKETEKEREAECWRSFLEVPHVKFVLKLVSCTPRAMRPAPDAHAACCAQARRRPLRTRTSPPPSRPLHPPPRELTLRARRRGASRGVQTAPSCLCTSWSCFSTAASPTLPSPSST